MSVPPKDDATRTTIEVQPDKPVRKRRGPKPGTRPSGRSKGAKNKRTLERELVEEQLRHRLELELEARLKNDALRLAEAQGPILMKDILFQLAQMNLSLAAFYQPYPQWSRDAAGKPVNANTNYDEDRYRYYSNAAREAAHAGAPFQSPRYSAVMVGAATLTKIEVTGGMPDDFKAPTQIEGTVIEGKVEFAPGTIITADDEQPDAKPAAA